MFIFTGVCFTIYNYVQNGFIQNKKTHATICSSIILYPSLIISDLYPFGKTLYRERLINTMNLINENNNDKIKSLVHYQYIQVNPKMSKDYENQLSYYLDNNLTNKKLYKETDKELLNLNLFTHMKYHNYYSSFLSFIFPISLSMVVKELKVKNNILEYFKNINKIVKKYDIAQYIIILNLMNFSYYVTFR